VRQAIGRQLPAGARPDELVFPGPGGSNGVPRGVRTPLSTHNLRRVYQAAVTAAGEDLAHLDLHGPHDLRHTFATWLEDAGIPSRLPRDDAGHARPRHHRPRRPDQPRRTDGQGPPARPQGARRGPGWIGVAASLAQTPAA
jgi:integrase